MKFKNLFFFDIRRFFAFLKTAQRRGGNDGAERVAERTKGVCAQKVAQRQHLVGESVFTRTKFQYHFKPRRVALGRIGQPGNNAEHPTVAAAERYNHKITARYFVAQRFGDQVLIYPVSSARSSLQPHAGDG